MWNWMRALYLLALSRLCAAGLWLLRQLARLAGRRSAGTSTDLTVVGPEANYHYVSGAHAAVGALAGCSVAGRFAEHWNTASSTRTIWPNTGLGGKALRLPQHDASASGQYVKGEVGCASNFDRVSHDYVFSGPPTNFSRCGIDWDAMACNYTASDGSIKSVPLD